MTFLTSAAGNGGVLPSEYAQLIIKPLTETALPFQDALATTIRTEGHELIIPTLESDASAAWVNEGEEISPSDPTLGETPVAFKKVAGLTLVSKEMAMDASPDAQAIVGESITRSIIAQVNKAWLGNEPAPAPAGLASLTGTSEAIGPDVTTPQTLDVFAMAASLASNAGRALTGWALNPTDVAKYATIKESSGSNRRLLDSVATIDGLPVFPNPNVPVGTAWGVDAAYVFTGLRSDVELAVSDQAYFSSDRVAIRATARIGFGFPSKNAIVKLSLYTTA